MKDFDPRFTDLPDYILKCTAQIWEGRDIAGLDWHYGEDLVVRTPAGINQGNAAGKANTMAALSEFPDRQLLGEDVIWCGDDQSGFLSSHRIVSTATHRGGSFGPATGRASWPYLAASRHTVALQRKNFILAYAVRFLPRPLKLSTRLVVLTQCSVRAVQSVGH